MYHAQIGKSSLKVKNIIGRGWVKKFAEAIGDLCPIYYDEEACLNSDINKNIAPVTFPVTLDYGKIPELQLPAKGLIHGEQKYHYNRPLYVGETVYCYMKLKSYTEKQGNSGTMGIIQLSRYVEDEQGETICETESVIILSEAVRKELSI